jgi:hypothetical protein
LLGIDDPEHEITNPDLRMPLPSPPCGLSGSNPQGRGPSG